MREGGDIGVEGWEEVHEEQSQLGLALRSAGEASPEQCSWTQPPHRLHWYECSRREYGRVQTGHGKGPGLVH